MFSRGCRPHRGRKSRSAVARRGYINFIFERIIGPAEGIESIEMKKPCVSEGLSTFGGIDSTDNKLDYSDVKKGDDSAPHCVGVDDIPVNSMKSA